MLFEEKKSRFWLIQYSKGLKFWKKTRDSLYEQTPSEQLKFERWFAGTGKRVLGVKPLTREQYDYYTLKGL